MYNITFDALYIDLDEFKKKKEKEVDLDLPSHLVPCGHYRKYQFWRRIFNGVFQNATVYMRRRHTLPLHIYDLMRVRLLSASRPKNSLCQCINFLVYGLLAMNLGGLLTSICQLFMSKKQYHCNGCGICRIGGRENFFHCNKCRCCYSVLLKNSHPCVEGAMHNDCPVCFEYLFESRNDVTVMPYGHTIHESCLKDMHEHYRYACPICSKSVCDMSKAPGLCAASMEDYNIVESMEPDPAGFRE
ncbi:putative E3 ubiquitin-protein ligase RZFP34 [Camellia lanceoleosa]|uniref:E3 ubiquitin-protein ligase RZFP34 n=1 Tax=Camellia lanceoleosa TaxID=1840588 RepID=A0ACC0GBP1_9ERIC|nr:putative E3 ubiquitin-protein ligase RZFP34 [Camellia lanceoleosa]